MGPTTTRILLSMLVLSLFPRPAAAQDQRRHPMISDRPGVYCGAQTVGRGVFHIETGFSYDRQEEGPVRAEGWFFPVVFRYGLTDDFEVRLKTAGPGRVRVRSTGLEADESGFASPVVEVKWKVADLEKTRLALLFSADLEAGSRAFRPARTEPAVNFATDWSLGESFSLNTNVGVVAASTPMSATESGKTWSTADSPTWSTTTSSSTSRWPGD